MSNPALAQSLAALTPADLEKIADLFATISYREFEFGRRTDFLFRHRDTDTILHAKMVVEAARLFAEGVTPRDIDNDAPYFSKREEG